MRVLVRILAAVLLLVGLQGCGGRGDRGWGGHRFETPRTVIYFTTIPLEELPANLALLKEAAARGQVSHVLVGLFHCDWADRPANTKHTISYNGILLDDPGMAVLWQGIRELQSMGVEVLASIGGGPKVGDFRQILDPDKPKWRQALLDFLHERKFDGLDLDIEEWNNMESSDPTMSKTAMSTAHLRELLTVLRRDFGPGYRLTSAPVGMAMVGNAASVSPEIDYSTLLAEGWFDWLNVQFYNGYGTLEADNPFNYEAVIAANPGVSPRRILAGALTSPKAGTSSDYLSSAELAVRLRRIRAKYPDMGGAFGWNFKESKTTGDGAIDPVGWLKAVTEALGGPY